MVVLKPSEKITDFLLNDRNVGTLVENLVVLILYKDWVEAEFAIAIFGDESVGNDAMKFCDVYNADGAGAVAAGLDVF